ncbi:HD domain-containing phosphohydrolase [Halanaerobaculum tunisiense]
MVTDTQVSLFDMVMCLSDALDLVNPVVTGHHKRVAYIASSIAEEMELSNEQKKDILIAGALHDVGVLSLEHDVSDLFFDFNIFYDTGDHAQLGYQLLHKFSPFGQIAKIIRDHHKRWDEVTDQSQLAIGSQILHLADRVDVLTDQEAEILGQRDNIRAQIKDKSGTVFAPEVVTAFLKLINREAFWFDISSQEMYWILKNKDYGVTVDLNLKLLLKLSRLFGQIIDFRSQFTATHSSGVAASAEILSELIGFSADHSTLIKTAGNLHDLGKLAIPADIINKEGKLTQEEFNIVKQHPFYTYQILSRVNGLGEIINWAAFHHEQLDGNGYPFALAADQLSLEARVMAVADVFTAITEDRPYRVGMSQAEAIKVLTNMVDNEALDGEVVDVLITNYGQVNKVRNLVQTKENKEYNQLKVSS